jgi:hypothetical protein
VAIGSSKPSNEWKPNRIELALKECKAGRRPLVFFYSRDGSLPIMTARSTAMTVRYEV